MKVYVALAMWNPDDGSADAEASVVGVATTRKLAATLIARDIINDMTGDVEDDYLPDPNLFLDEIEDDFRNQKAQGRWDYRNSYTEYQYVVQLEEVQTA